MPAQTGSVTIITYQEVPLRALAILATMLRHEGLEVEYQMPREERGFGTDAVVAGTMFVTNKMLDATVGKSIDAVVAKIVAEFKQRFPGSKVDTQEAAQRQLSDGASPTDGA